MTPLSLLALSTVMVSQTTTAPKVIEYQDTSAEHVVLTALMKAPDMNPVETASWPVLANSLLRGSNDFTAQRIFEYGTLAGKAPVVMSNDDFLSVQITVPVEHWKIGVHLIGSIMTQPSFHPEQVAQQATAELRALTAIEAAMNPYDLPRGQVNADTVKALYEKAARPESLVFVVAGPLDAGQGTSEMATWLARWRPTSPRLFPPREKPSVRTSNYTGVSTFELRSTPLTPSTPYAAARILATVALGAGKDCTMWRTLRQEQGQAYWLEGFLWPTKDGWVPRFQMAKVGKNGNLETVAHMLKVMTDDVETWDQATLDRAVLVSQASLSGKFKWNPFRTVGGGTITDSLSDRALWRGYLEMTGSGALSVESWSDALGNVTLETFKEQAVAMLNEATPVVIKG